MSTSRGNAGEHLVMAELLIRGFEAYMADRGNPAFDISCRWPVTGRTTYLRVKTTDNSAPVWSNKKSGLFLQRLPQDDFVVICNVTGSVRNSIFYVVPTGIVEEHLVRNHTHYVSMPGKNGPRNADANIRVLRFFGPERPDNLSFGYDRKFADFADDWASLK